MTVPRFTAPAAFVACLLFAAGAVPAQEGEEAEPAGEMRVTDYGVGKGVKARQLVGRTDRFLEGRRVWFWTRVVGGTQGDRVRHVWLREGEEVFSIGLAIGGDHWRTYSNKTLPMDGAGKWAVEIRTAADKVLARQEFLCLEAGED